MVDTKTRERASVGLALGGGAARGSAHIGVLRAMEESELRPEYIAGTSIGALVGGLYAFGVSLDDMRKEASKLRWMDMASATLSRFGLLTNQEVGRLVERFVGDKRIEDAAIPFAALATDVSTGQPVVLKEGPLSQAVMASAAIPGVFVPVELDGKLLVDGGLCENVPLSPLQAMGAEVIVAVDINGARRYERPESVIDVMMNAIDIAIDNTTRMQLADADLLISLDLAMYSRTDSSDIRELVAEGYRAAALKAKELENLLSERNPSSWQVLEQRFRQWRES